MGFSAHLVLARIPRNRYAKNGEGGLKMSRTVRSVVVASLVSLGSGAAAWAATPAKNGVYQDGVKGIIVGVHGTSSIHAFDVACHGRTWVAQRFIPVMSRGGFSYRGPAFLVKNRHRTSTMGTITASGRFRTSRLIVGRFAAPGCSGRYSATFSYSRR
jgi:hypothetical protein